MQPARQAGSQPGGQLKSNHFHCKPGRPWTIGGLQPAASQVGSHPGSQLASQAASQLASSQQAKQLGSQLVSQPANSKFMILIVNNVVNLHLLSVG